MSFSRLQVEDPVLAAQLERTAPEVVRELAYLACSSASPHALAQGVLDGALSDWRHRGASSQSCSEIAAQVARWDDRYSELVAAGAGESEWLPYFRSARAGSAVVFALKGDLGDAIYEAVHAVKGVGDLVETLRLRLGIIG
jgi:hypothetical protein